MYEIKITNKFKKDYKLAIKRGYNSKLLNESITLIASGAELPE